MARGILYTFVADGKGGYIRDGELKHVTFDSIDHAAGLGPSQPMKNAIVGAQILPTKAIGGESKTRIVVFINGEDDYTYGVLDEDNGQIKDGSFAITNLAIVIETKEKISRTPARPSLYRERMLRPGEMQSGADPAFIWQPNHVKTTQLSSEEVISQETYYTAPKFGNRRFTRKTDGGGVSYYEAQEVSEGIINIADEKGDEYQPRTLPPSPLTQKTGREVVVAIASAGDNGDKLPHLLGAVSSDRATVEMRNAASKKTRPPSLRRSILDSPAMVKNDGEAQSDVPQTPYGKEREAEAAKAAKSKYKAARDQLEEEARIRKKEIKQGLSQAYAPTSAANPSATPKPPFDSRISLWPLTSTPLRPGTLGAHNRRLTTDFEGPIARLANSFDSPILPFIAPGQARSAEEIRSDYEDAQAIFDESGAATQFREKELLAIQVITEGGKRTGELLQDSLQAFYKTAVPRWKADIGAIREVEGDSDAVVAKKNSITRILYILLEHARIGRLNLQLQQNLVDLEGLNRELTNRLAAKEDELDQASHTAQNQSRRAKAAEELLDQSQVQVEDDLETKDLEIRQLRDKIKTLNGRILDLERDLRDKQALDDSILGALEGFEEQQQQVQAGQKQIKRLTDENATFQEENERLSRENKKLGAHNVRLAEELNLLRQQLDTAVEEIAAAEAATLAAQKALREAQAELAQKEQDLVDAKQELERRPQAASRPASTLVGEEGMNLAAELAVAVAPVVDVAALQRRIEELDALVLQRQGEASNKDGALVEAQALVATLQGQATEFNAQWNTIRAGTAQAKQKEGAYQQGLTTLEDQVKLLEAAAVAAGALPFVQPAQAAAQSAQAVQILHSDVATRFNGLKARLAAAQVAFVALLTAKDVEIARVAEERDAAREAQRTVAVQLTEAKAAKGVVDGELAAATTALAAAQDQATASGQTVAQRAQQNAAQAAEIEGLRAEVARLTELQATSAAEIARLTAENARLKEQVVTLTARVNTLTAEKEGQTTQIQVLTETAATQLAKINALEAALEQERADRITEKAALEQQLQDANAENARLTAELAALRAVQAASVAAAATHAAAIAKAQEERNVAVTALAQANADHGAALVAANGDVDGAKAALQARIKELVNIVAARELTIATLEQQLKAEQAKNLALTKQVAALEAERDGALARETKLKAQVQELTDENTGLKAENATLAAARDNLQRQVTTLAEQLQAKTAADEVRAQELAALQQRLNEADQRATEAEAKLAANQANTDGTIRGAANLADALTQVLGGGGAAENFHPLVIAAAGAPRVAGVDPRDAVIEGLRVALEDLEKKLADALADKGEQLAAAAVVSPKPKGKGWFSALRNSFSRTKSKPALTSDSAGEVELTAFTGLDDVSQDSAESGDDLQTIIKRLQAQIDEFQKAKPPVVAQPVQALADGLLARINDALARADAAMAAEAAAKAELAAAQVELAALQLKYYTEKAAWAAEKEQMRAQITDLTARVRAAENEATDAQQAMVALQAALDEERARALELENQVAALGRQEPPAVLDGAAHDYPALMAKIAELEGELELAKRPLVLTQDRSAQGGNDDGEEVVVGVVDPTLVNDGAAKIAQLQAELDALRAQLLAQKAKPVIVVDNTGLLEEVQAELEQSQARVQTLEQQLQKQQALIAAAVKSAAEVGTEAEKQELSAQAQTYMGRLRNLDGRLKMLVGAGVDDDDYPKKINYQDGDVIYVENQDGGGFVGIFTPKNGEPIQIAISADGSNFAPPNAGEHEAQFLNLDSKVAELEAKRLAKDNEALRAKEEAVEATLAALVERERKLAAAEKALKEKEEALGKAGGASGVGGGEQEEEEVVHGSGAPKAKTPSPAKKNGAIWGEAEYITTMWGTSSTMQHLYIKRTKGDDGKDEVVLNFELIDEIATLIVDSNMLKKDKVGAKKCIETLKELIGTEVVLGGTTQAGWLAKSKEIAGLIYKGTYTGKTILKKTGPSLLDYVNQYNDMAKVDVSSKTNPSATIKKVTYSPLAGGRIPTK